MPVERLPTGTPLRHRTYVASVWALPPIAGLVLVAGCRACERSRAASSAGVRAATAPSPGGFCRSLLGPAERARLRARPGDSLRAALDLRDVDRAAMQEMLARLSRKDPDPYGRIGALVGALENALPRARELALLAAVDALCDPDELVRHEALAAVGAVTGLRTWDVDQQTPGELLDLQARALAWLRAHPAP